MEISTEHAAGSTGETPAGGPASSEPRTRPERGAAARANIAVAGAGFVGLALATALAQAGLDVMVLDPALDRPGRPDPRALTIAAGPRRLLEAIGVWTGLASEAEAVRAMEIGDARLRDVLRPVHLTFDGEAAPGEPFAHVVENETLRSALLAAARKAGVRLQAGAVAGFRSGPARIAIEPVGLGILSAAVLVAADGARSRLREQARIRSFGWLYDQTSIVTTVGHALPHGGRAIQHFLEGGPFALLPLPGQRSSVVWTERRLEAQRLVALSDDAFLAALQERAGPVFGALSLAGPRAAAPIALQVAQRFAADRMALIGDAAHAIHPLAGQGLNLGFRDVAALAEAIVDAARLGLDPGSAEVLGRYERWRRFDTMAMVAATDGLLRLFRANAAPYRLLRDLGLGLTDRAPRLKAVITRAAAGLAGEAPRLLRGEPL